MRTPFEDYVTGPLGTPYRWWRLDSAVDVSVPDAGDSGAPTSLSKSIADGTWTHGLPGLIADDASKCIEFTANTGTGTGYRATGIPSLMADENIGSMVFFFKGNSTAALSWLVGTHPDNAQFATYITSDGTIYFILVAGTSSRRWQGPAGLNDNGVHMFGMTCDGTNPNRLYIDGALHTTTSTAFGAGAVQNHDWMNTARAAASSSIILSAFASSRFSAGGMNTPWLHRLDEIMLFSQTLTDDEMATLWFVSQPQAGGRRTARRRIAAEA
jgi:hypothetical protein